MRWLLYTLFGLFARPGYRCDRCEKWTPRWRGRATPVRAFTLLREIGPYMHPTGETFEQRTLPRETYWKNTLVCPSCARELRHAEEAQVRSDERRVEDVPHTVPSV
jgi:hypothetical protein